MQMGSNVKGCHVRRLFPVLGEEIEIALDSRSILVFGSLRGLPGMGLE